MKSQHPRKSQLETADYQYDYDEYEEPGCPMFNLRCEGDNQDDPYVVTLNIAGTDVLMEIDTGSRCSVINSNTFKSLKDDVTLLKSNGKLTTYMGENIPIEGIANVRVTHKDQTKNLQVTITKTQGPNLIGRNWLREIGLDWSTVSRLYKMTDNLTESDVFKNYKEVFYDSLGTFSGPKVKIHVERDAKPRFFKARSVPLAYKSLVEQELERLEETGVIKSVQFSDWATPIVPILKPDGKVRICGNYAVTVNQIAKGDAYPIPNINELYNKLSGGVIYSKLDLSHAYQQLVLDDESRKYTTINTSKGLFEYTRLPFGINAAPDIFQRTMENLLSQIPMTTVYLDDILIAGKTVEEHDKHLKMVLDKLQQHGMKLKKSKCMLMKTSIEYLGHKLDADGIHPTDKKFEGVQNAVPPKNVSELCSFL